LRAVNDVAPFWDALTTRYPDRTVVAEHEEDPDLVVLDRRRLRLYPALRGKRLELTALVYVLFLGMCVGGVMAWRRIYREQSIASVGVAGIVA